VGFGLIATSVVFTGWKWSRQILCFLNAGLLGLSRNSVLRGWGLRQLIMLIQFLTSCSLICQMLLPKLTLFGVAFGLQ